MCTDNFINYNEALKYWSEIPPTLDGVLGGFAFISDTDIEGSELFLKKLITLRKLSCKRSLDCGAGIGRVTKYLLSPFYDVVDIVEPDEKFVNTIHSFVGENKSKIGIIYKTSLQDFMPEKKYDLIWNQWVLGYLTDADLVSYLIRCRNALNRNGVLIVKENVTSSGKLEVDETDSSVTRSLKQYIEIFQNAKLTRIKQSRQANFPSDIYPVYMFALIPNVPNDDTDNVNNVNDEKV